MFLEISQNAQENTCTRVSFLIKLQAEAYNFIKKGVWYRYFPVNFVKFLRTTFLQNTFGWLLLNTYIGQNIKTINSKKLDGLLEKMVLLISDHVSIKMTFMAWTKWFNKKKHSTPMKVDIKMIPWIHLKRHQHKVKSEITSIKIIPH